MKKESTISARYFMTPAIRNEMRRLFMEGRTKTSIAKEFSCGITSVIKATADLKVGYNPLRKYPINKRYFDTMSWERAYILGLLWADGCLYRPTYSVVLANHVQDKESVVWVAKQLGAGEEAVKQQRSKNCVTLTVTGKEFYESLLRYGLQERKSTTGAGTFCRAQFGELFWDFVRGLLDGDGCVSRKKSGYVGVNFLGNKPTITALYDIFNAEKIYTGKFLERQGCCQFTVAKRESVNKLYQLLYKNVQNGAENEGFFGRKRAKFLERNGGNQSGDGREAKVRCVEGFCH